VFEKIQKQGTLLSPELDFNLESVTLKFKDRYYNDDYIQGNYWLENKPGVWFCYSIKAYGESGGRGNWETRPVHHCTLHKLGEMVFDQHSPAIKVLASVGKASKEYTKAEVDAMDFKKLTIKMPKWKGPKDLYLK